MIEICGTTPESADVAEEDLAVAGQPLDALLDAGAGRIVDADDRAAVVLGQIHDLDHLLGERLAQRAAEDGEILREDGDLAAVDRAEPGHDAVAVGPLLVHAETIGAVLHEGIEFDEGIGIEQRQHPLARAALAALALFGVGGLVLGVDLVPNGPVSPSRVRRWLLRRLGLQRGQIARCSPKTPRSTVQISPSVAPLTRRLLHDWKQIGVAFSS